MRGDRVSSQYSVIQQYRACKRETDCATDTDFGPNRAGFIRQAKIAERNGIDFKGSSFEIEKHMQESPRRIARLTGVITLPPGLDPAQREKLLAAVRACPVSRSLHPDIALEFEYR